ncbi:putative aminotransferase [Vulcanimicrobium alpinum]|uniref:Aminotransferase n=1 Tax=Vulcanimicrobium alpinum TaxID=3016050 RepID=A0AAN1XSX8_UNVUL|nr:aminotransferase class III-fold pyridoxal phosphate-dependent enzyme [Vulcanimicrobium alpinum]BDE05161.1 putative aminotransferase [Vulcanimicrobium alpinum]
MIAHDPLAAKHARYVLTPWAAQGGLDLPVIVRGEGVYLYDDAGNRYLDLTSGLIAVNLGHGHPAVLAAMHAQIDRLCFSPPAWFNDARAELGEALSRIAPWGDEGARAFFTTGGAGANEDAVKFAREITGRPKVLAGYRSFHGSGAGSATLTGENRRWFNEPANVMGHVVHFWAPYPYRSPFFTADPAEETQRALQHVTDVIAAENPAMVAAILIEPVVGSNGVIVYPAGYLAGLRALCDRHGILLILDEVMTGFGRTGSTFASETFGVVPDLMTFAKGVTSAYVPLGGVLVRERYATAFDAKPLPGGHTYSGHPLAMAAGVAAIRAYQEGGFFTRGRAIEQWLRAGLEAVREKYEIVGEVRGVGAFFAMEFVASRETREPLVAWQGASLGVMPALFAGLRKRGAYGFGRYNVMHVAPPLTISDAELDEGIAIIDAAVGDLAAAHAASR